jgi:hypothetical protein
MHDLMLAVGPAAGGMIASSRRRLLAHMAAGRADEAGLEMERHLRGLHYMWRLASRRLGRPAAKGANRRHRWGKASSLASSA